MGFGGAAKPPPPSLHPRMQVVTCTSKKLQHARYRRAIAPRKAIARIRLDRVQSRNAHHHVDAIVDLLDLQIGARTVGFQILIRTPAVMITISPNMVGTNKSAFQILT